METLGASHPGALQLVRGEDGGSRVIHEAGVGHLLEVDSNRSFCLGLTPRDAQLDHVLQIGKASPDVPEVFHGVCPGTRIPVSAKTQEGGDKGCEWEWGDSPTPQLKVTCS